MNSLLHPAVHCCLLRVLSVPNWLVHIYNIIYTCFTCTKIITLHIITVDVTVTAGETAGQAIAGGPCTPPGDRPLSQ